MAELIPLEQAARMLGMTTEKLNELRSRNEVFGYRDGSSWKFKLSELERVAADLDIKLNQSGTWKDDDSEYELGDSSAEPIKGSSSEIFGDSGDLVLESGSDILASESDIMEEEELSFGSSSLRLAADSSKKLADSGSADLLDDEEVKGTSSSDTGKMLGNQADDLMLAEDDLFSDELSVADSSSFEDSSDLSSDFEDSDLVMEDSDSSSEVTLEASGSGIDLGPTDSGLLREEPLELGGSDIDALELPEDDDMIVLDEVGSDSSTVMQEDDFNLTPLEDALDDESSGSQVIALEDSEIYTDDSATILGSSDEIEARPAMLPADVTGFEAMPGQMGMMPVGIGAIPEAPYSLWQVLCLSAAALLLLAGSMIAYAVAQNIWMPNDRVVNESLLNFFLSLAGMN